MAGIALLATGCDLLIGPRVESRPPRVEVDAARVTTDTIVTVTGVAADDYGVEQVRLSQNDRVVTADVAPARVVHFRLPARVGSAGDSLSIEAVDAAGNIGRATIAAPLRDTVGPRIELIPPSGPRVWTTDSVRLYVVAEDSLSGVATLEVGRDAIAEPWFVHHGTRLDTAWVAAPGRNYQSITARDSLGNAASVSTVTIRDNGTPDLHRAYAPTFLVGDTARFYLEATDNWGIHQFRLTLPDGSTVTGPDDPEWTVEGGTGQARVALQGISPAVDLAAVDFAGNATTATVIVETGVAMVSLTAGDGFTCGVDDAGTVYCWGANDVGQLGRETVDATALPAPVSSPLTFATVSAGSNHACALTAAGAAYCWGGNGHGQLGDGTVSTSRPEPAAVVGGHTFAQLEAGFERTCALTTEGEAFCWGRNERGQLGIGTTANATEPTALATDQRFASVSGRASALNSCGITLSDAAYCWGANLGGEDVLSPVVFMTHPTLAWIAPFGEGWALSYQTSGYFRLWELPEWSPGDVGRLVDDPPAMDAPFALGVEGPDYLLCEAYPADIPTCATLARFGEMWAWAPYDDRAFLMAAPQQAVAIGQNHICGVAEDGSTYCVGRNDRLQLGIEPSFSVSP